jgi:threonine synthase
MPREIPRLTRADLNALKERPWPTLAQDVMASLLHGALSRDELGDMTADTLSFPIPMVQLSESIHVLELFHGPTLAFKDVGARFMARLLGRFRREGDPAITVLTATSGDTGGAVAQSLHGVPGVRVVVLFPDGKVTPRQERQFSTLGGNVLALAVQGDFDDCQRLAKEAFAEDSCPLPPLTSANSINVGRFLPQATYFFKIWQHFAGAVLNRTKILISVPSGNFGNLAAGLLAKQMGLPNLGYLAATNRNDVVPRYLQTGLYSPRPSIPTLSTAMDVGNPSNLDRILHLYRRNLPELRKDLVGQRVTDEETQECIRRVFDKRGYVLDPHSAVGLVALEAELQTRPGEIGVLLATAHPAKFAEVVEPVLGESILVPPGLASLMEGERRIIEVEPRLEALQEILES